MSDLIEIVPGLYQSGTPHAPVDVDVIVSLQREPPSYLPQSPNPEQVLAVWWPINDGPMPDPLTVRSLARFVASLLEQKQRVLVHCAGGNNRSGLIVGRTLIERGSSPDEAIETVRSAIPTALNNREFEHWLRSEGT
ncbi:MAG: dual specificity protein phosphatase family protein [Nitriliruptorales bacterium]